MSEFMGRNEPAPQEISHAGKVALREFSVFARQSPEHLLSRGVAREAITSLMEGGVIEQQTDIKHRHYGDFYLTEAGREFLRQNGLD